MFVMTRDPKDARADPENVVVSFKQGVPSKVVCESTNEEATESVAIMCVAWLSLPRRAAD
jgi:argininosuccinate synthase